MVYEHFTFTPKHQLHKWTKDGAIIYTTDFKKWHIFDRSCRIEEHDISFDTLIVIMYEKKQMYYTRWEMERFIEAIEEVEKSFILEKIKNRPKLVVSD